MCRSRRGRRQIKKFKDALRSRLLGGRRRMVHNLLPMPERVLKGSEYGEARRAGGGRWNAAAWMQIAALPRRSFNLGPSRLPRKERSSPIIARDWDAPKRGYLDSKRSDVPALLHRDDYRISFWSYHSNQPPLYVRLAGVGRPVHVRSLVGWRIRTDRKTRLYGHRRLA